MRRGQGDAQRVGAQQFKQDARSLLAGAGSTNPERVFFLLLAHNGVFVQCLIMLNRSQIRVFSRAVARKFHPRKIVLFGS